MTHPMIQFYQTYKEEFKACPESILEIGSRDGKDAELLRSCCDLAQKNVYVVEPHPFSYHQIIKNFPEFNAYQFAIFDKVGILDFNAIPPPPTGTELSEKYLGFMGTSSLLKKNKEVYFQIPNMTEAAWAVTNPNTWIKVLTVTGQMLLQLIDRPEIDLVKIDVEGATYDVLKSFGDDLRLLKALHLEVEKIPIWENEHLYADTQNLLNYYGFKELSYDGIYFGKNQGDNVWVRIN